MSSYDWTGWESEEEATDGPARPDTHFITIREDGEEIAVIIHRTCGGQFPLDGELAKSKEAMADRIVAGLRGEAGPQQPAPDKHRIVLEFEDAETLQQALEYLGESDAPVAITGGSVESAGHTFQLWDDYDAAMANPREGHNINEEGDQL